MNRLKDFTAHRNPGLDHAFLAAESVSSLQAELLHHERTLSYGGKIYKAQGDFIALRRLAPCDILISYQVYRNGEDIAVFRIKATENEIVQNEQL